MAAEVMAAPYHNKNNNTTTTTAAPTTGSLSSVPAFTLNPHQEPSTPSTSHTDVAAHRSKQDRLPISHSRAHTQTQDRMSQYSLASAHSRPQSNLLPPFQSSLSYALVRDFAYPPYHPMHFGGHPEHPSGASTPSEWNAGRRASDSAESSAMGGRTGPWGGDGLLYGDPDQDMEPLPSTAFASAAGGDDWADDETSFRKSKHRKSRSFHDIPNYERGRRRESSRTSRGDGELAYQQPSRSDPAGRDALRQSRGFTTTENGENRRDSHFATTTTTTLPNRSFHTSQQPIDPDSDLPLDAEPSLHHSPQRESMGPEDEELFAGKSLALYGFEPENENELRLMEGQIIMVSYRHGQGWLVAENPETGEQGLVPEQYVRLLRDIEGWDEEKGQFIDEDPFAGDDTTTTTPIAETPNT
ncbi:hypothetical protein AC579_1287 [Pseudocercospora musae]|uniref:SH3 domain-containing protein n=1 Tax=Pseudocercospora musae TaxID=113226 RepID=A0A139GT87_9PEZI|nr:hypothetical protein AC579_1287 [Pseudocercospora musae]